MPNHPDGEIRGRLWRLTRAAGSMRASTRGYSRKPLGLRNDGGERGHIVRLHQPSARTVQGFGDATSREAATGVPEAIASATTSPNGSSQFGVTAALAGPTTSES